MSTNYLDTLYKEAALYYNMTVLEFRVALTQVNDRSLMQDFYEYKYGKEIWF